MIRTSLLALAALLPVSAAHAANAPDLAALIECKARVHDFAALQPAVTDQLKAVALGWTPLPATNPFMTEFKLNTPITVYGTRTDHIAFAGPSIMAVLDMPDPHPLAHRLKLEAAVDNADKVMYGREVVSEDTKDPKTGEPMIESIILSVSNVKSHPGKTLAGCSYSLDYPETPQQQADDKPRALDNPGPSTPSR